MKNNLASENVIVSAPFSFAGSAQRIWRITHISNALLKWLILIPIALVIIIFAWMFVATWYFFMYFLFGIFFIPFRLWRRSVRKNKRSELRHQELLAELQRQGDKKS